MTVRDLIDSLEALASEYGDETEARLAHQPQWPFEYSIDAVAAVPGSVAGRRAASAVPACIYIGEGEQLGYLPGRAGVALGWSNDEQDVDDDDACPGCGCTPGEGRTPGCTHPDGCGYHDALVATGMSVDLGTLSRTQPAAAPLAGDEPCPGCGERFRCAPGCTHGAV